MIVAALASIRRSDCSTARSRHPSISTVELGWVGQGSGVHGSRMTGELFPAAATEAKTAAPASDVINASLTNPMLERRSCSARPFRGTLRNTGVGEWLTAVPPLERLSPPATHLAVAEREES
jgi:hypothetical protein